MLQNPKHLYGRSLRGTDGEIGYVTDFYFDDVTWTIRYVVADTGSYPTARRVLVRPQAFDTGCFESPVRTSCPIRVNISRGQVEERPSWSSPPPSRPCETTYPRNASGLELWRDPVTWAAGESPTLMMPLRLDPVARAEGRLNGIRLHSTKTVTGHRVEAVDGRVGSVEGFVIDAHTWTICELIVAPAGSSAGGRIILLPAHVRRIAYEVSTVYLNRNLRDLQEGRKSEREPVGADSRGEPVSAQSGANPTHLRPNHHEMVT